MHRERLRDFSDSDLELRARLLEDAERVARIGSWEWVIGTRRTRWSDETYRLFGRVPGEIEPSFELFLDLVLPEEREGVALAVQQIVETGRGQTMVVRIAKPDRSICDMNVCIEVITDDSGKPERLVGVVEDISVRKAAERKQAALVKELEEVNRELGEFAYIVSHDLKAPLRGIGTLADWIARDQREHLDADGKEQMDLLLGRVKRMNDLIDGILRYSRIGRAKEEIATLDLGALTADVIDLIAAPSHVKVIVDGTLPTLRAARTQVAQVFQNLIGNAVKFCDKPAAEIHVSCVDEGNCHRFEIRDNGPGIDARHFQRIFQIFQTLAPRDRTESTGIGLSIVKKIVETMGGRIWVESTVGLGSRFFFTIPKTSEQTCEQIAPFSSSKTTPSIR